MDRVGVCDLLKEAVTVFAEGLKRIWFKNTVKRLESRGAARLKAIAKKRIRREVRRRGREVLKRTAGVARFTAGECYPIRVGKDGMKWGQDSAAMRRVKQRGGLRLMDGGVRYVRHARRGTAGFCTLG